jgi:pantothenate kinase
MTSTRPFLLFLFFFLQVQAAAFTLFESSPPTFVTTPTWTAKNRHLDSFSFNVPVKRRRQYPKQEKNNKKALSPLWSSRSSMDETYDTLAQVAIDKLNLLRQQQQDNENENDTPPRRRRRLWIGLVGGPGSGKSTVAKAVVERLNQMDKHDTGNVSAMVLPMDGFHYTQAHLKEHGMDMKRRGAPWTFDAKTMYEKLHAVVHPTSNGNDADHEATFWFPSYGREISDPVENAIRINSSHDIIIVEGLYMLLGALVDQAQDPESPLMQMIQKFPDKWPE